ncbi:MAG: tRNA (N(6)-L-threonylcarbamoyladenosine(37)-C(2))-methylthiotransferase [archaeon]|jgi:MiaB-like tRNA modifying enzyme|nr:tRNA (N(6)-L-threonylcarbamoyladenosine(37)-C(2))-methylthiotransferase [archaeon]
MNKTFYLEGFGCSMNSADGERIVGFLESNGFKRIADPAKAQFILLNSCAVKVRTERKMLRRARELSKLANSKRAQLVVCGCLPKINPTALSNAAPLAILAGPGLEDVAEAIGISPPKDLHTVSETPLNPFVSIIPIAKGCVGECTYCSVKAARGQLESFSEKILLKKFKQAAQQGKEIWITAQDTGCYGLDTGSSLPALLKKLLASSRKKFRVRVGMMNPQHIASFFDDYISLFEDQRMYRFFHVPIQSGSDKILGAMKRPYKSAVAKKVCKKIRAKFPLATISTDWIVGFPGETESDFGKTVELLKEIRPDISNVSRFGARPKTIAKEMSGQVHGGVKKARSSALTDVQAGVSLARNRLFLGAEQEIFVSDKSHRGHFVGRNQSYKHVAIDENLLGQFVNVEIEQAFRTYLKGRIM